MPPTRLVYVLSPAKTLDFSTSSIVECSQPRLLSHTHTLVKQLRHLSPAKLQSLLGVSGDLAKLNFDRFQQFDTTNTATEASQPRATLKPAVVAFHGPAYQALDASSLSESDLAFAQTHLRILCGLYGLLRPLDLIQPYRLEMGHKLVTPRGTSLYDFWHDTLVAELKALYEDEEATDEIKQERVLVNLASQEYFKSLPRAALETAGISVVECVFKDDGRIKSVYAKRARGLMVKYLIEHRVHSVADLSGFHLEGYKFSPSASSDNTFVFTRTAADQKRAQEARTTHATRRRERKRRAPIPHADVFVPTVDTLRRPKQRETSSVRTCQQ
ncbi:hypothetical protein PsorP6_009761 [Peronosclerospora sorghi]|uniref:Uncharacterized protein n=1 Tax=Peronosclerospora sorghi TaxID=230839 RepID=A0ACC0VYJ6_9STRA|nr:hypothetical protein PsorP6_009761 [Peronosclerospora sorghi]